MLDLFYDNNVISDSDSFVFSIILELYWAEECFKRAISHYADFLWRMKKDLWSAEEMYLQALSIEPNSTYRRRDS
ncbi:hypothetical protein Peur_043116 [Populus x canadensis]